MFSRERRSTSQIPRATERALRSDPPRSTITMTPTGVSRFRSRHRHSCLPVSRFISKSLAGLPYGATGSVQVLWCSSALLSRKHSATEPTSFASPCLGSSNVATGSGSAMATRRLVWSSIPSLASSSWLRTAMWTVLALAPPVR